MSDTEFPVETYKEAARHLRRPFTQAAVKFKVQATWPKDNPTGGLIVAYIDARLTTERLNLVVPHLWHDTYRPVGSGQMWCDLTIDGITRSDVGEGVGKALVSDSFKRAGVKFGIGVSLYAIPKMMLDTRTGALKQKRTKDGLTLELTPRGEAIIRDSYAAWLDTRGVQAFGEPLDHGDAPDAMGDAEDGNSPVVPEDEAQSTKTIPAPARHPELRALFRKHKVKAGEIRTMVRGAGFAIADDGNVLDAVNALTDEQAATIAEFIYQGPMPMGATDVPADAEGFTHPVVNPADDGWVPN